MPRIRSTAGEGCAGSAAALLGRLRPLAVLVEAHEKPLKPSSAAQEHVAAGPRYAMHSLVREIAAGMLASRSLTQQSRVRMAFADYMLSRGEELLSMEVSFSTLAPALRLLSNELVNFGGLVPVLEQLDCEHCCLDPARIGRCEQLASALVKRGHLQPAVALLRVALRACDSRMGPDDLLTLTVTARLADTLGRCQQLDEADQLGRRVLSACERLLGPQHPHTITARAILALIRLKLGKVAEALTMQRAVLVSSEEVLGHFHADTVFARGKEARALLADGQLEEAERMLERVLEAQEASLGPKHLHTIRTCATLADVMGRSGRPEEATLLRCRVLWMRLEVLGAEHMDTQEIQAQLISTITGSAIAAWLSDMLSLLGEALEPTTLAAINMLSGSDVMDTVLNAQWLAFDTLRKRVETQGPDSTTTVVALAALAALIVTPHPRWTFATWHKLVAEAALGPAPMSAVGLRPVGAGGSLVTVVSACQRLARMGGLMLFNEGCRGELLR